MGYYGMISTIKLEFLTLEGLQNCLTELEQIDVADPLRGNEGEAYFDDDREDDASVIILDCLDDYELKLNGTEEEYLPVISKYAHGYIEIRGDEVDDYRRFEVYGNGTWAVKYGQVVYE
jgi:hypothetical protein